MNAVIVATLFLAGYALGRATLRDMPHAVRAWWNRVGALPGISRRSLYALLALQAVTGMIGGALISSATARREDALESRLRQCEQGQQQAHRNQQQSGQANPQWQRRAGGSFHAEEVAQQASTGQSNQQAKRHTAQRVLACSANGSTDDKHDDVAGKRFGGHGPGLCVSRASIAQGGAA